MNEAKARDVRVYLLHALMMISHSAQPDTLDIQSAYERVKRAERLLHEMVEESIIGK